MSGSLWGLPGPRKFVERIGYSIWSAEETPLLLLPDQFDVDGVRRAISAELELKMSPLLVDVSSLNAKLTPLEAILENLQIAIDFRERLDAVTFVARGGLDRRIVFLDLRGLESAEQVTAWSQFLMQFASAAREVPVGRRCAICAIANAWEALLLPEHEPSIRRFWWWGVLSRLDGEVYVANSSPSVDFDKGSAIVELAAYDFDFMQLLLEEWDGEADSIGVLIEHYTSTLRLEELPPLVSLAKSAEAPPHQLIDYWASGVINSWSGIDPCVHIAIPHESGRADLKRRIWRAQVRALFPEVELERQRLAAWVKRRRRSLAPEWADTDIDELEIGPLWKAIRENSSLNIDDDTRDLARWLAYARNRLAHLDVLTQNEIREGRRYIQTARERGTL